MKNETVYLHPIPEPMPIKDVARLIKEQERARFMYAAWRFDMWYQSHGSYTEIEAKVDSGEMTPGVCPGSCKDRTDCLWLHISNE